MRLADNHWLARLEYLHYDFSDAGSAISTSSAGGALVLTSGDLTVDVVRAGLSYKFGGPTPAATSAYGAAYDWASPAACRRLGVAPVSTPACTRLRLPA